MSQPALNLFIDAGALLAFSPTLPAAAQNDHQVLQLYAQLAADKAASRDSDTLDWYDRYIAALKKLGMCLPRTEHHWFEADVTQTQTLPQWLSLPEAADVDDLAWPKMVQAMQRLAAGAGDDQSRQLLHAQAVGHTVECSSLDLLLAHVATGGAADLWFVRLRTRELIGRNLFAHEFAGNALLGRIEVFHHAGLLGEGYVTHRALLADLVAERRQGLLLPVVDASGSQP